MALARRYGTYWQLWQPHWDRFPSRQTGSGAGGRSVEWDQLFPSRANPLARSDVRAAQLQRGLTARRPRATASQRWGGGQEEAYFRQQQLPGCGSQHGGVPRSSMAAGEEEEGRS